MHNFLWSTQLQKELPINASRLWEIISKPSNLENFHPFCSENPVMQWPGKNSVDKIHYYNGLTFQRNFVSWIDHVGYDLFIGEENKGKSYVSWRIEDLNEKSKLTISIYPHVYNSKSKLINFLPFFLIVNPSLKKYLHSVLSGLEYYVRTHKKVKKNQFGTHKIFSN